MTVSMDSIAARYAAACETNGHRVEMITTNNIETMVKPLLQEWCSTVNQGRLPEHVLYFRDGVSEGQYQHVLRQEVRDLKRIFENVNPNAVVRNHITILAWEMQRPVSDIYDRSSSLLLWLRSVTISASSLARLVIRMPIHILAR